MKREPHEIVYEQNVVLFRSTWLMTQDARRTRRQNRRCCLFMTTTLLVVGMIDAQRAAIGFGDEITKVQSLP